MQQVQLREAEPSSPMHCQEFKSSLLKASIWPTCETTGNAIQSSILDLWRRPWFAKQWTDLFGWKDSSGVFSWIRRKKQPVEGVLSAEMSVPRVKFQRHIIIPNREVCQPLPLRSRASGNAGPKRQFKASPLASCRYLH